MRTAIFSESIENYETQKALRKTKICLTYLQSIGLSGLNCYLSQCSFFPSHRQKNWKIVRIGKNLHFSITEQVLSMKLQS